MKNEAPRNLKQDAQKASNFMKCRHRNPRDRGVKQTFATNEINHLSHVRADGPARAGVNLSRKDKSMITVTALALLIYLFGGYDDYERRQKNECTKS
jgi:hypothetical protein